MSALGVVVSPGFLPDGGELAELRPAFLRSILFSLADLDPLLATGLPLLVTVNNEMQEVAGWSGWDAAIAAIADRGQEQIFGVCVGNEFDLYNSRNPADVPPEFAADLVRRASVILRPRGIKTIATSVAGPDWQGYLERMAALCRDEADYFDAHFYGQRPDGWSSPGWMFGDLRPALIRARELCGKPVIMSEYGVKVGDAGGEEQVAAFLTAAASTITQLGPEVCPYAAWFAWHDGVGAPSERGQAAFGLVSEDGRRRPAWAAFAALATVADVIAPEPDPVLPEPEPVPMHTPDEESPVDPWQYFSSYAIAAASQCPIDAVQANWPKLVAQMDLCGIADRPVQVAMIGTVAKESASTFRPIHEYGTEADWSGYDGGARYAGRGFIQNTHRSGYADLGPKIAQLWGAGTDDPTFDLVANPDNLLDPDMSAAAAAIFFRDKRTAQGYSIPDAARAGDWDWVRRLVLGGPDPEGSARIARIADALDAVPAPAEPVPLPAPVDEVAMLQDKVDSLVVTLADVADRIGDELAVPTLTKKKRLALVAQMRREREEAIGPRPAA